MACALEEEDDEREADSNYGSDNESDGGVGSTEVTEPQGGHGSLIKWCDKAREVLLETDLFFSERIDAFNQKEKDWKRTLRL